MKTYYDNDANIEVLSNENITIVGYGVQGRAQALNLRDSGVQVNIGNIKDHYFERAKEDGFEIKPLDEAVKGASVIMLLIPDQAQKSIYNEYIKPHLNDGTMLVVAHGYSIYFNELDIPKNIDVALLAPRMPGIPIREQYLNGSGVPAFVNVHQDYTGNALERVLGLAKAMGFTKPGLMDISLAEETEIDLFIEQFYLPIVIHSARTAFDVLTKKGFTPSSTLMELYASGELGELLLMSAEKGIYQVWKEQASPTCQYGIARALTAGFPEETIKDFAENVLDGIRNGKFYADLKKEAEENYPTLNKYNEENEKSLFVKTQTDLTKNITLYKN